jgi:PLP dependent protein
MEAKGPRDRRGPFALARVARRRLQSAAMDFTRVAERVAEVRARIDAARARAGRAEAVTLVAVTKTHPAAAARAAIAAGVSDLAENRVQELDAKVAEIGRGGATWHLIGHLQRNKARRAIPLFDLMHALDSQRLAETISAEAVAAGVTVRGLVQVNVSGEGSKGGFAADGALDAVAAVCALPGLRVEGLMTMAPFDAAAPELRRVFGQARRLFEQAAREAPGFEARHLSMGMSNDFEIAVEEGSTLVRLGSVLFGERQP